MDRKPFNTPILFVVFNRPDNTRLVFEEIRKQRPASLFIAADGPRESNPGDAAKCTEVRKIVSNIDWPCDVHTLFREKNLGFRDAERLAFDWFFENVEEGIILEDDQLPHPSFFRYISEMLEKYRNDEKIMMITGGNFLPDLKVKEDYFFSKHFPIWGWATWRRAWNKYDFDIKSWGSTKNKRRLKAMYPQKYVRDHLVKMFDEIYYRNKSTWDTQWMYACIMNNGFCITPRVNLISNIGVSGTHQGGSNQNLPVHDIYRSSNLLHPQRKEVNTNYDNAFNKKSFSPRPFSLKRWVVSVLVKYESIKILYRFLRKSLLKIHTIFYLTPKIIRVYINKVTNKLYGIVHVPASGKFNGNVLLSYITSPFVFGPTEYPTDPHTNYWECSEIARLFSVRGYSVDIIDANNTNFKPHRQYKAVVDTKNNLEILSPMLPSSCKKVMHITSSYGKYQNTQEKERLVNLKNRRGVSFTKQRVEEESDNPMYADFLEGFGNKTVHASFLSFKKPIHPIPISVAETFDFPQNKDFSVARKHFLFFGGGGAILKGLDLVIEAFSVMPNLHIHIVGPASYEKEFSEEYKKELALPNVHRYQRPKISKNGVLSIGEGLFSELADTCAHIIYPSASEGTSGAVIQAIHAGVIPIVTKETGLSEKSSPILIEDPSVESIVTLAQERSEIDPELLYREAYDSWEYVNKHHTKEKFSDAYADFIDNILDI
ncbi:hypothetical protein COB55_00175 [Candidatus Wolfebacteria bacterium]|nr:MAG: hypothetical protein COB55_00175 [Candidatus Wolfebacteria bacterium]